MPMLMVWGFPLFLQNVPLNEMMWVLPLLYVLSAKLSYWCHMPEAQTPASS